jgi:hypothetical protein
MGWAQKHVAHRSEEIRLRDRRQYLSFRRNDALGPHHQPITILLVVLPVYFLLYHYFLQCCCYCGHKKIEDYDRKMIRMEIMIDVVAACKNEITTTTYWFNYK